MWLQTGGGRLGLCTSSVADSDGVGKRQMVGSQRASRWDDWGTMGAAEWLQWKSEEDVS